MERATRKGFVSMRAVGSRKARQMSPLAIVHRQWCDARTKPQILLYKACRGRPIDEVIVDLSPLRINAHFDDSEQAKELLGKWKEQVLTAAENAGMELLVLGSKSGNATTAAEIEDTSQLAWDTDAIWKLPYISVGVFEGERSKAKAMAAALSQLWDIPDNDIESSTHTADHRQKFQKMGRSKLKGWSQYRKRGGGHRQAW
jgi:hypothetical protein